MFTCYTLSSKAKIKKELTKKSFTKIEIKKILESLKEINLNTINEYKENKMLINKLIKKTKQN